MNDIAPWINTFLLIIILFYQWNRNKIYSERIYQQTQIMQETKLAVTQQSTVIESQSKVVETAIKYSEAFDPKKFEDVVRKQVEMEYADKIVKLEKEVKGEKHKDPAAIEQQLSSIFDLIAKATADKFLPVLELAIALMVHVPVNVRKTIIEEMSDGAFKDMMSQASEQIEVEYSKVLAKALSGYSEGEALVKPNISP